MIKMTKIVLINWMYFQKATLPIVGNTAIVGVNGTGKSTIIDAIQMLLLGQRASKFNSNANAEKRSLESYVRGHINMEDKEYLRPGDVITYLAFETFLNNEKHIFGIYIDYKANLNRLSDIKYFYIKGRDLADTLFIDGKYPKTYDVFSKEMKANFNFIHFQTLLMYQNKLKEIFGLKAENTYFKILSRAVGIKNINDCNTFMNEFILDENPIDVSSIKDNIVKMRNVSQTIEKEQNKLEKLIDISDKGIKIENDLNEMQLYRIKINIYYKTMLQHEINQLEDDNQKLFQTVKEKEKNKEIMKEDVKKIEATRNDYIKLLDNISPDLPQKQKELDETRLKYDKVHIDLNTFLSKCKSEISALSRLSVFKNEVIRDFTDYISNGNYTTNIAKQKFSAFRNEAKKIHDSYYEKALSVKSEYDDIKQKLIDLDEIINKLRHNQPTYKPVLSQFIEYIKNGLYDKYNEQIEVKFLCEYLEITDDSWRNAIEGYLGHQRFYIVVPNKYYKDAIRLYQEKKEFFATRIINGSKISDYEAEEGTLSQFVNASNVTALNFTRYVLNRVCLANDVFELDKYDIAITKDCMLYQGYSIGRINPRNYLESYIGIEGIKNQLNMRIEQQKELSTNANDLLEKYYQYKECTKELNREIVFASEIIEDNSLLLSIDEDEQLYLKLEALQKEIDFYKSSPEYMDIQFKIDETENQIKLFNGKIDHLTSKMIDLKASMKSNDLSIETKNNELIQYDKIINEYETDKVNDIYEKANSTKITMTLINDFKFKYKELDKRTNKLKNEVETLMREARDLFSLNYEPFFDSISKFNIEKDKINQSVFKFKAKLIEINTNTQKLFFSQFLTKLYTAIEKAKEQIINLNHTLSEFTFGNDYYKIKIDFTENRDLQTIYDYAKAYNSEDSERGVFIDRDIEDRERKRVQELVNQYMFSEDIKIQNFIVDYRNYLYFDVINHTPNGAKSLNKVIKSQSGGEVQSPFYILSGVAFQQTLDYKRNKDSSGIVLYDEAFDKMDDQRIQSMLDFYKNKLNLQLILAAPGKLGSLVDSVETILTVIRDGDVATVSDITHEI